MPGMSEDTARPLITQSAGEFSLALGESGALLGLDLGTKTLGVATCDPDWRFATGGKTLVKGKFAQDCAALSLVIAERAIRGVVIGLPLNMNGSEGPRAQSSRAYARNLSSHFGLPILLWDERWSTQSAEREMIAQDFSRKKRAERIDSHAAAVILQGAIDALSGALL